MFYVERDFCASFTEIILFPLFVLLCKATIILLEKTIDELCISLKQLLYESSIVYFQLILDEHKVLVKIKKIVVEICSFNFGYFGARETLFDYNS